MPDDKGSDRPEKVKAYNALSLAFLFPASIVAGFLIGYGLDKLFDSGSVCTIIFSILGSAGAFLQLFRFSKSSDGG